jgi:SAM-dependent methyltransferase
MAEGERGMGSIQNQFFSENEIKASFSHAYVSMDPRNYFGTLGKLDYIIPELARPIFYRLADHVASEKKRPITILDIGCSYGINAALLKRGLSFGQLRDRYTSPVLCNLSSQRAASFDRNYFRSWPSRKGLRVIGLDASAPAVDYALKVGLLDAGLAIDLENERLDESAKTLIAEADLIISTGCVGYVTATTFDKILGAFPQGNAPWVASFVLRMFSYADIESRLANSGLLTERYEGATFIQRRFRDDEEQAGIVATLKAKGIDPSGKETEGAFHAELFVSRPSEAISSVSLEDLLGNLVKVAESRPGSHGAVAA